MGDISVTSCTYPECDSIVVTFHRFGIKYSFSKEEEMCPNLAFLEFLAEFSQKLLDVDKTGENGV